AWPPEDPGPVDHTMARWGRRHIRLAEERVVAEAIVVPAVDVAGPAVVPSGCAIRLVARGRCGWTSCAARPYARRRDVPSGGPRARRAAAQRADHRWKWQRLVSRRR